MIAMLTVMDRTMLFFADRPAIYLLTIKSHLTLFLISGSQVRSLSHPPNHNALRLVKGSIAPHIDR